MTSLSILGSLVPVFCLLCSVLSVLGSASSIRDPKILCDYIRSLKNVHPTPEQHAFVLKCLRHKWHGVRIVAGQVLQVWGSHDSVDPLRAWLMRCLVEQRWIAQRIQACKALVSCINEHDVVWILDLYFSRQGMLARSDLFDFIVAVLTRFPLETAEARIAHDCRYGDEENSRASIIILGRTPFPGRDVLLEELAANSELMNREYVELYRQWKPFETHPQNTIV